MTSLRHKITIASFFPIFPPQNLFAHHIFNLYKQIAHKLQIEIISLSNFPNDYFQGIIAPGLSETRIPKSIEHRQAEKELRKTLGSHNLDWSLVKLWDLTPEYLYALQKSAQKAITVICIQPFLYRAIRQVCNKPIWYQATSILSDLDKKRFLETEIGLALSQEITQVEKQLCQESELIITTSEKTVKQIKQAYHVSSDKIVCLSNYSYTDDNQFISYRERLIKQAKLGLRSGFFAIFNCLDYSDNVMEIEIILRLAAKLRQINFLILGNIGLNFNPRLISPNVGFITRLNTKVKSLVLDTADIALNPTTKSADSQAQMIEYFLRGVPIISTPEGIDDFDCLDNQCCLVGETWEFPELLLISQKENITNKESRIRRARDYIGAKFTGNKSGNKLIEFIHRHVMES